MDGNHSPRLGDSISWSIVAVALQRLLYGV